ncbi:unnamed protein product [Mytilus edulis]|uniref:MULE transposase domain-containing protein n=1 Tax=Mytilus edulis TaxID=6550 RepID=A0A8S3QRH3_MYTED|nr:unnamed protein product [Mytilus edulis]
MNRITEGLNNKKSCIEIYQDMVPKSLIMLLKDLQQVHTKKHYNKKQVSHAAKANIADEVLQILSMVNDHDFVKEVVYTQDNSKPPSIICYTSEQIADIKTHLQADPSTVLGVERTFNLGSVFVTNFVIKIKSFSGKSCGHQYSLNDVFPWDSSMETYHTFFSHFKARILTEVQCFDVKLGSDDEGGLRVALDSVFSKPDRLLCTKHIKDNVTDYIKNKLPLTSNQRSQIMSNIFNDNGIATADDTIDFDIKSNELCNSFPCFANYFEIRLKTRLFNYVNQPFRKYDSNRLWTNNNCESMNHRFKVALNWKPHQLPELLDKIYNVIQLHHTDLKRSIVGNGNYELFGNFKKHRIQHSKWHSLSQIEKEVLYRKLASDKKFSDNMLRAANGFAIPKVKRLAKKPGQRHRPRTAAVRTKPKF